MSVIRTLLAALAFAGAALLPVKRVDAVELTGGDRPNLAEIRFEDLSGHSASLESYRGKVVVLNLWATWCAPCRDEMPSLDRLQAIFPDGDVRVLAVSLDRGDNDKVTKFLGEIGVSRLTPLRDPQAQTARLLKVPGLPATLLIDRSGRQAGRVLGIENWDSPAAVAAVRALQAEPAD